MDERHAGWAAPAGFPEVYDLAWRGVRRMPRLPRTPDDDDAIGCNVDLYDGPGDLVDVEWDVVDLRYVDAQTYPPEQDGLVRLDDEEPNLAPLRGRPGDGRSTLAAFSMRLPEQPPDFVPEEHRAGYPAWVRATKAYQAERTLTDPPWPMSYGLAQVRGRVGPAEERAVRLLAQRVPREAMQRYLQDGILPVTGSDGGRFQLVRDGLDLEVDAFDDPMLGHCLHARHTEGGGTLPPSDEILTRYLLVATDEAEYRRIALPHEWEVPPNELVPELDPVRRAEGVAQATLAHAATSEDIMRLARPIYTQVQEALVAWRERDNARGDRIAADLFKTVRAFVRRATGRPLSRSRLRELARMLLVGELASGYTPDQVLHQVAGVLGVRDLHATFGDGREHEYHDPRPEDARALVGPRDPPGWMAPNPPLAPMEGFAFDDGALLVGYELGARLAGQIP